MKLPGKILIVQCTAPNENRYDELIGQVVTVIGNSRDHYLIDEITMTDCRMVKSEATKRSNGKKFSSRRVRDPNPQTSES